MKLLYRFALIFFAVILVTTFAHLRLSRPLIGIDDANIFFVYAKNFVGHNGFRYNPTGERVEGFTSLAWVLICSIFFYFSNNPEPFILFLNIILLSLSITLILNHIEKSFINGNEKIFSFHGLIFLAWAFCSPGFIIWNSCLIDRN